MRIVRLTAENIKRLRAVEITPDGNTVVIAGRNGQGKTSVMDAIWYALGGGPAAKDTTRPIRDGADHAARRNGTLDDYERASRPAEELLDEWVRLRADGYGYRDAAARLGATPAALDQALRRAKRRGDDRGCRSIADLARWRRAAVTDRRKDLP